MKNKSKKDTIGSLTKAIDASNPTSRKKLTGFRPPKNFRTTGLTEQFPKLTIK